MYQLRESGLAMNRFYTKQTKIFRPKKFVFDIIKVLKKLFVAQKINLEDTSIFGEYIVYTCLIPSDFKLN